MKNAQVLSTSEAASFRLFVHRHAHPSSRAVQTVSQWLPLHATPREPLRLVSRYLGRSLSVRPTMSRWRSVDVSHRARMRTALSPPNQACVVRPFCVPCSSLNDPYLKLSQRLRVRFARSLPARTIPLLAYGQGLDTGEVAR